MAASAKNRPDRVSKAVAFVTIGVAAATHIYQGTDVCLNSSGELIQAADTSGAVTFGVARQEVNNTGAAKALKCEVTLNAADPYRTYKMGTPAVPGTRVFYLYDDEVALHGGTSNTVCAGTVVEEYAGSVLVDTRMVSAAATTD